jgi:hypothetical protein
MIFGYFLNSFGDTVCIQSDSVACTDCCTGVDLIINPLPPGENGECCFEMYFSTEGSSCEISGVIVDGAYNDINGFSYQHCISPGNFDILPFYLVGPNGDTICYKEFNRDCPASFMAQGQRKDDKTIGFANVSPNPTYNDLTVEYNMPGPGSVSISIYAINGMKLVEKRTVHEASGLYNFSSDVSSFPAGVYFVRISSDNRTQTIRFGIVK